MPQPVDCNKIVAGMSELIGRTLGDQILVETVLSGGLWRTFVDPSQLESLILNLAVNGRDAMPEGGKLTVETANAYLDAAYASENAGAQEGQHVLVSVTDTGSGMTPRSPRKLSIRSSRPKAEPKAPVWASARSSASSSNLSGTSKSTPSSAKERRSRSICRDTSATTPNLACAGPDAAPVPMGSPATTVLVVEDEPRMLKLTVEAFRVSRLLRAARRRGRKGAEDHCRAPRSCFAFHRCRDARHDGPKAGGRSVETASEPEATNTTGFSPTA